MRERDINKELPLGLTAVYLVIEVQVKAVIGR
jgi:hypothetical protein